MVKRLSDARLFSILAWVLERGGASIFEISQHFKIDEELVYDAVDTLGNAYFDQGLPDQEIGLDWNEFYENKYVVIFDLQGVYERIDLSDDETIAFVLGLNFLSELLPDDLKNTAATASLKLLAAKDLKIDLSRFFIFDYEDVSRLRDQILKAIDQGDALQFNYVSASSKTSARRVIPSQVGQADGHWIVDGRDIDAGAYRRFRLDRMDSLEIVQAGGAAGHDAATDSDQESTNHRKLSAGDAQDLGREVRVVIAPEAKWATEGRAKVTTYRGVTRAIYNVLDSRWMENQLLLLGSGIVESSDKDALLGARERARKAASARDAVRAIWHT